MPTKSTFSLKSSLPFATCLVSFRFIGYQVGNLLLADGNWFLHFTFHFHFEPKEKFVSAALAQARKERITTLTLEASLFLQQIDSYLMDATLLPCLLRWRPEAREIWHGKVGLKHYGEPASWPDWRYMFLTPTLLLVGWNS